MPLTDRPTRLPALALALSLLGAPLVPARATPAAAPMPVEAASALATRSQFPLRAQWEEGTSVDRLVSFEQPWSGLSRTEQLAFKRFYEGMPEGDEPPSPVGGLKDVYGPLQSLQDRVLVSGDLVMEVVVEADGQVQSIKVLRAPDRRLRQWAANLVMLTTFKPGRCAGQPCRGAFPVRAVFR